MAASKQPVGILGGTFDPVHDGHIAIAKSFLKSGYIDSLTVFLTPNSPHKQNEPFASYTKRLRMLMAAFEPFSAIKVSNLEYTLPRPSYTVQTLHYFKKSNPEYSLYLCLGQDSYNHFHQWHKWEEILQLCKLLVAKRPGEVSEKQEKTIEQAAHFIRHEPIATSSTQIRECLQQGKSVAEFVPSSVLDIIKEEELYVRYE